MAGWLKTGWPFLFMSSIETKREYDKTPKRRAYRAAYRKSGRGRASRLCCEARARAREEGIEFSITAQDVAAIWPSDDCCPVFKVPFVFGKGYSPFNASIDRLIPSFGYVVGNIRIISRKANTMKQDATWGEIQALADWVQQEIIYGQSCN